MQDLASATASDSGSSTVPFNEIYFSSEVNRSSIDSLVKSLRNVERLLLLEQFQLGLNKPRGITIYVDSFGGSFFEGLRAVDVIQALAVPTTSVIEGATASAGTLISMACNTRKMSKNSHMLIHQVSSCVWGTSEQIQEEAKHCREWMKRAIAFYAKNSLLSKKKLKKILKKDRWFDSDKCLAFGLVDSLT